MSIKKFYQGRITALVYIIFLWSSAKSQTVIPLYPGVAPGSESWTWSEQSSSQNAFNAEIIYNVSQPTLTAYLPPADLATGTAVIVAPGGAFHILSINSEGIEVAKWLNSKGVAAFVLKYRLARILTDDPIKELTAKMSNFKSLDEINAPIIPLAMADGLAAVKYVREHAAEMSIDPSKIGFMGFSAGGTLTMSVVYNASEANRPNFVAPIYPYEPAIIGSTIPQTKTPIFVAVAADDQLGMLPMGINIFQKWWNAKQPAELHAYEKGGHGFGMRKQKLPVDTWQERFGDWLKAQGYLKKLHPNKYERLYGEEAVAEGKIRRAELLQNDYGQLARYQMENKRILSTRTQQKQVVFLGNSITEGWYNQDSAFFNRNNFVGRGISGQTSSQVLLRFRQDVLDLKPTAVLINIGVNDIAENTGPYHEEVTFGNIQSMTELAQAHGIQVILSSILPTTKFEWRLDLGDRSGMIVSLNQRLQTYAAKKGISFIDYHTAMKNSQNGLDSDLAEDGVHPTLKGYQLMESLALPVIKKVVQTK